MKDKFSIKHFWITMNVNLLPQSGGQAQKLLDFPQTLSLE